MGSDPVIKSFFVTLIHSPVAWGTSELSLQVAMLTCPSHVSINLGLSAAVLECSLNFLPGPSVYSTSISVAHSSVLNPKWRLQQIPGGL